MTPIRVLMADDHKLFIDGLGSILQRRPDMEVVGAARDGLTTVGLATELKPDIVLMDISMPHLNGIEATRKILTERPTTRVIMLSMHSDPRYVVAAFRAGARGYLLKDSASEDLLEAIERVCAGEVYLSSEMSGQIVLDFITDAHAGDLSAYSLLSPREREVLQLIAEGHSTKDIAARLSVSVKTVETHRKQVMDKLDLHSIAELTKYAIREGLTEVS
ncbi:MAG: response regulator transcription factor [Gemmatimonadetes bacterium]|nr:response regulator transcription factor [Gemmatimonadota bacterium]